MPILSPIYPMYKNVTRKICRQCKHIKILKSVESNNGIQVKLYKKKV